MWYFIFFIFWLVVLTSAKIAYERWRNWRYCQPARYVSEIRSLRYFQSLTVEQLAQLVVESLRQREYKILGQPLLAVGPEQGYAWKAGKRTVVAVCHQKPLTAEELNQLVSLQSRAKAHELIVFTTFTQAATPNAPSVQVIGGEKLVSWFSVLGAFRPPVSGRNPAPKCECGSPMNERVNRAGAPLFVCSRYPDCKNMLEAAKVAAASAS